ncbi:MAG: DNA polymerase/3'-5' exonuclease PolX [Ignavibacteriae bacterium]|nr:DNA polymerase/3'-5' exonuclease PolX [Ignavibacteriota bacterium]NOG98677.1 DNA polymerase/3'-5' exonuclease PolX [Ignavibacteriota bacterium]
MPQKKEIIKHLKEIANLLDFNNANRFKVNAFKNGATALKSTNENIEPYIKDKTLTHIKGIGKGIQQVIYEFSEKGESSERAELIAKTPKGILELFKVRGLGAKKIQLLYDELNISSIADLEHACNDKSILSVKGFTEKGRQNLLEEISNLDRYSSKVRLNAAYNIVNEITEQLQKLDCEVKFDVTGDLRRNTEIISKIEILIYVNTKAEFYKKISNIYNYNILEQVTYSEISIEELFEIPIKLYVIDDESSYYNTLFQTTGSKSFVSNFGDRIFEFSVKSEEKLFDKLNTTYVIPEMREQQYFDYAPHLTKNSNLNFDKFKGLLHFHTTQSDGLNSLEEMTGAANKMGFEYAAVCDHSKTAVYANGLNEDAILEQRKIVDTINSKNGIKVFHGIESDILSDGSLDYAEEILSQFDFIVISIHSSFTMGEEEMTNRIIKAVENKYADVLAHPTGRLLLAREPYKVNIKKVIDACAANDVAIEINANPQRLDLDWREIYYAREKGCKFAINPDAHSVGGISDINYGIKIARKGGMQSEDVINCYSTSDFIKFLNRKVKRKTD